MSLAVTLAACGGGEKAAPVAKAGLGVVSSMKDGQVNSTFAAIALDAEGKIVTVDIDVAQSSPAVEGKALTETKEERKEAYGMAGVSPIGKEWFEQAEAFEAWCVGKTPAEVAAAETKESNGHQVAVDADLYAGCTMQITDFQKAVEKAAANAVEVAAEKVVLGRTMANNAEKAQVNTTLFMAALDAEGKIVAADIEVAQIYGEVTDTKTELKEGYGMKGASPIGKEWYEQAAAFETFVNGKTLAEVSGLETKEHNGHQVAVDADLYAGCTMDISAFTQAAGKAK